MTLYRSLVDPDLQQIRPAEWKRRREAGTAVGRCSCGGFTYGEPVDAPAYMTVVYYTARCDRDPDHERLYVNGRVRPTERLIDDPGTRVVPDITSARNEQ